MPSYILFSLHLSPIQNDLILLFVLFYSATTFQFTVISRYHNQSNTVCSPDEILPLLLEFSQQDIEEKMAEKHLRGLDLFTGLPKQVIALIV